MKKRLKNNASSKLEKEGTEKGYPDVFWKMSPLREKCPNTEFILDRISPHLDWIRRDTEHLRIQSEYGKIRTKKKTSYLETFHAVFIFMSCLKIMPKLTSYVVDRYIHLLDCSLQLWALVIQIFFGSLIKLILTLYISKINLKGRWFCKLFLNPWHHFDLTNKNIWQIYIDCLSSRAKI